MRPLARRWCLVAAIAAPMLAASTARADVFDLALERLVPPAPMGGFSDPSSSIASQADYRQLVSELSVALAPKIMTTADTIGFAGFQMDFDASFTTMPGFDTCTQDPKNTDPDPQTRQVALNNLNTNQCPVRGFGGARAGSGFAAPPGVASTLSVNVRKGIWLPLPSFELGAGATKLMQSDIFAVQVFGKFALHEGYHGWPIPSLAVIGAGLRVMGAPEIDLTMASVDGLMSKSFGILGSATLVPYLGGGALIVIPRSKVLDTTPSCDSFKTSTSDCNMMGGALDLNANAVFPDQDNIVRYRFFGGLRLQYSILQVTADFIWTAQGDLGNSLPKIPDRSPSQYTFSLSGGLLF